jgi:hypothetical protein
MGERVLGLRSNRLSVPRALLIVNVRAAQQLVYGGVPSACPIPEARGRSVVPARATAT